MIITLEQVAMEDRIRSQGREAQKIRRRNRKGLRPI